MEFLHYINYNYGTAENITYLVTLIAAMCFIFGAQ